MAISIDDTSTGAQETGATLTISHTIAAGGVLVVYAASAQEGSDIITGVTWNTSEALTLAVDSDEGDATYSSFWYIKAPTATTANVVITTSATTRTTNGLCMSFLDADTDTLVGVTGSQQNATASTASLAATSTATDSWMLAGIAFNGDRDSTVAATGTNQTLQIKVNSPSTVNTTAMSTQTTTSTGSYTNSWSWTTDTVTTHIVMELLLSTSSTSPSISPSISPSTSLSASISPSTSPSTSPSASPSISPSVSPSESPSVSPSPSPGTWTTESRNASTFVNETRTDSTWANNPDKSTSSWYNQTKQQ